ncbi:MAG: glycerate kinase [Candidatus Diapherotrites archaeon]
MKPRGSTSSLRVLVSPAPFKGTLTAAEAADAIAQGVRSALPQAKVELCPIADGGEGTVEAIASASKGAKVHTVIVHNPLGKKTKAKFLVLPENRALIEMAEASGLLLVPENERSPLLATTFGTGQLILAALDAGCTNFIIGIGGSATNDGGAGMAQALGVKFFDGKGKEISVRREEGYCAASLENLARIDASGIDPRIARCKFTVACDVTNPLCGEHGASVIYGPQKGATHEMVKQMDAALRNYAAVLKRDIGIDVIDMQGAGAAGGLGAGLFAFLGAEFEHGADLVMEITGFEKKLAECDIVITGEGCIDSQTCRGKAVARVALLARRHGKRAVAIGGKLGQGHKDVLALGISAVGACSKGTSGKLVKKKCFLDLKNKTAEMMRGM